jgi:hypothetical protein
MTHAHRAALEEASMRIRHKLALLTATAVLASVPAVALAAGAPPGTPIPPPDQGTAHRPSDAGSQGTTHQPPEPGTQGSAHKRATPGPNASLRAKAKAYGKYCQAESKNHVAGQRGTPFSKCVTAMAKLASGKTEKADSACKDESKKHVAGEKGTPFSRCVSAAAKLKRNQSTSDEDSSSDDS